MPGPLDKLFGPGKQLQLEAPDAQEFAGLDVDERLVTDLIAATQAVVDALPK